MPSAVERARAAREERARAAATAAGAAAAARRNAAASVLQSAARPLAGRARQREQLRSAWSCPEEVPPAGQRLALTGWFLHFHEPARDGAAFASLCRLTLASLAASEPRDRAFGTAALERRLTRRWVEVLHGLILACAAQLSLRSSPQPSATLGPVLRLLLALADPDTWPLVRSLASDTRSAPTARALRLMASTTFSAAAPAVVRSVSQLILSAEDGQAPLDRATLGAAATIAAIAACGGGGRAGEGGGGGGGGGSGGGGGGGGGAGAGAKAGDAGAIVEPPPRIECVGQLLFGVLTHPALCDAAAGVVPHAALARIKAGDSVW
jgi:hypothetical protein